MNNKPFIEFEEITALPHYNSAIELPGLKIRLEKKFNWFNRLMLKICFGIKVTIEEEE